MQGGDLNLFRISTEKKSARIMEKEKSRREHEDLSIKYRNRKFFINKIHKWASCIKQNLEVIY
jgi:hypothetical protein